MFDSERRRLLCSNPRGDELGLHWNRHNENWVLVLSSSLCCHVRRIVPTTDVCCDMNLFVGNKQTSVTHFRMSHMLYRHILPSKNVCEIQITQPKVNGFNFAPLSFDGVTVSREVNFRSERKAFLERAGKSGGLSGSNPILGRTYRRRKEYGSGYKGGSAVPYFTVTYFTVTYCIVLCSTVHFGFVNLFKRQPHPQEASVVFHGRNVRLRNDCRPWQFAGVILHLEAETGCHCRRGFVNSDSR